MSQPPEFVQSLEEILDRVRGYVSVQVLDAALDSGLADALVKASSTPQELAGRLGLHTPTVAAVLEYLETERFVERSGNRYSSTPMLGSLSKYRGWLRLFHRGYGSVLRALPRALASGPIPNLRDVVEVGAASGAISRFDSIPLTLDLLNRNRPVTRTIIDFGCGNGQYLVTFCQRAPQIKAIGIESTEDSCRMARDLVREHGLEDRIEIIRADVHELLLDGRLRDVDAAIFAFVLHELLAQHGEQELVALLGRIAVAHPGCLVIVIEVDRNAAGAVLRTPVGRGYYGSYFLIHELTFQQLMPRAFWEDLFARAGFRIRDSRLVDPTVDPTGLEVGFALEAAPR